jgi:hypothetical protein
VRDPLSYSFHASDSTPTSHNAIYSILQPSVTIRRQSTSEMHAVDRGGQPPTHLFGRLASSTPLLPCSRSVSYPVRCPKLEAGSCSVPCSLIPGVPCKFNMSHAAPRTGREWFLTTSGRSQSMASIYSVSLYGYSPPGNSPTCILHGLAARDQILQTPRASYMSPSPRATCTRRSSLPTHRSSSYTRQLSHSLDLGSHLVWNGTNQCSCPTHT